MNPITDPQFLSSLDNSYIAIDTCCLIDTIKYPDVVGKFMYDLTNASSIYTVPGVVFEYYKGADSKSSLRKRKFFLEAITGGGILPIDKQLLKMTNFLLIMNKVQGKCDLGEYQLIASMADNRRNNRYLLTENDKDIPTDFIDRVSVVTFNLPKEIKTYGFYKINFEKYEKIANKILTEEND